MSEDRDRRWRLALGGEDEALAQGDQRLSGALTALYGEGDADEKKRRGGLGASAPNVARWMSDIREYFPSPVVQIVQKDAFDRLGLQRMLLEPEFLAAVEADINLVATLISLRNVMPDKARDTARQVIAKVVAALMERLERKTAETLRGAVDKSVVVESGDGPTVMSRDRKIAAADRIRRHPQCAERHQRRPAEK